MSRTTPTDRRLYALVTSAACLGLAALGGSLADLSGAIGAPVPAPPWQWLGIYTLLVTASRYLQVQIRIRTACRALTWTNTVIIVGLAVLPAPWVVVATAVGVLVAAVLRGVRPWVAVFSLGRTTALTLVAALVLSGFESLDRHPTAWGLAWLAAAFAVMTAIDELVTTTAVSLDSKTRLADRLRATWDVTLAALAGQLAVALVAVLVLERQPQLAYALPLLVLLGHVWHERWVRAREERRAWRDLATTTASFTDVELDTVLRRAVTGGARLFSAAVFEVELWSPKPPRLVRGGPDWVTFDGDPADAPPDLRRQDAHEMALQGSGGRPDVGVLRLRLPDRVKLSAREHAMMATYVAALETAVRNATAYGRLRHATAAAVPTNRT